MSKLHTGIRIVCLLTIAALLLAGIGVAYGRYSSDLRETLAFQAEKSDVARVITIRSEEGWHTRADGAEITFSLQNAGGVSDQFATLRLTATEGFVLKHSTVILTVDDTSYEGVPSHIDKGDPLFDKMGKGTEYRFYTDDGECVWPVTGAQTYTLTVEGAADASLLRLTATEA